MPMMATRPNSESARSIGDRPPLSGRRDARGGPLHGSRRALKRRSLRSRPDPRQGRGPPTCASTGFRSSCTTVADSRTHLPEESARDPGRAFAPPPENVQDVAYRYRLKSKPGFEYMSPSATAITGHTPEEHYADPRLGARLVFPQGRPSVGNDPALESAVASTFL